MTNNNRRQLNDSASIDWGSIAIFAALMILGWVNIYAAVFDDGHVAESLLSTSYGSQLMWIGVSFAAAMVIMFIDEIYFHVAAYPLYIAMVAVLIATLFVGVEINGARSWLRIGGFTIQPAEFAKFATALALARMMSSYGFSISNWHSRIAAALLLAIPMLVILLQNDTGSAIVFSAFMVAFYREGIDGIYFLILGIIIFLFIASFLLSPTLLLAIIILICVVLEAAANNRWRNSIRYLGGVWLGAAVIFLGGKVLFHSEWSFYTSLLVSIAMSVPVVLVYAHKEKLRNIPLYICVLFTLTGFTWSVDMVFDHMPLHQQKRILNLLGVENDPQHWGYNVHQSKIAIGSGGLLGKGYLNGTQTKYDFVPEQSTDFIFSTVGEEWGFAGTTVVLVLFCWLILRLVKMGERQQEAFGRVYCYSVAGIFLFHVLVNVGMTIGIMPVIGIPLPLFSYGGSSLLAFTMLFFVAVRLDAIQRKNGDSALI